MGSILTIDIGATKTRMVEFDSSLSIDEAPSAKISGETEFHTPHHPNECFEILTNTILQNFPEFREHSDDTIIAIARPAKPMAAPSRVPLSAGITTRSETV